MVQLQMPPRAELEGYGSMELDFSLSCAGNMDEDCSVWDRVVSALVQCEEPGQAAGRHQKSVTGRASTDTHHAAEPSPFLHPHLLDPRRPE